MDRAGSRRATRSVHVVPLKRPGMDPSFFLAAQGPLADCMCGSGRIARCACGFARALGGFWIPRSYMWGRRGTWGSAMDLRCHAPMRPFHWDVSHSFAGEWMLCFGQTPHVTCCFVSQSARVPSIHVSMGSISFPLARCWPPSPPLSQEGESSLPSSDGPRSLGDPPISIRSCSGSIRVQRGPLKGREGRVGPV